MKRVWRADRFFSNLGIKESQAVNFSRLSARVSLPFFEVGDHGRFVF